MKRPLAAVALLAALCAAPPLGSLARAQEADPAAAPDPAETHKLRGVIHWREAVWTLDHDRFRDVADELQLALDLMPRDARDFTLLFLLGFSYTYLDDERSAAPALEAARELDPGFPGFLLVEAIRLSNIESVREATERRSRVERSLELLDEYLVRLPAYGRDAPFGPELEFLGHLHRGTKRFRLEDYHAAQEDLRRSVQISRMETGNASPELVRILVQCHQYLSEYVEAERLILESLRADPGEPTHYHVLGQLKADQSQYDEAKRWYEAALARKPDFPEPRIKLAYIAWTQRDLHAMRRHLDAYAGHHHAHWGAVPSARDAAIEANIQAGYGTYWMAAGERLDEEGEPSGAQAAFARSKAAFQNALEENPGCIRALNLLIQLHFRTGEPEHAEELRERLRKLRDAGEHAAEAYRSTFC